MKLPPILLLLCLVVAGCNPQDAGELKRDAGKFAGTAGTALGNAQLAARVNAALAQRKGVDMKGLHVESKGGVVTVGGHVRNREEKQRVVDTIEGIRGVEKVIDKLRIQP